MHDMVLLKNGGTVHEFVASLAHYLRSVLGTYKTGLLHEQLWRNLSLFHRQHTQVSVQSRLVSVKWDSTNATTIFSTLISH
jgi:hypothetical protein